MGIESKVETELSLYEQWKQGAALPWMFQGRDAYDATGGRLCKSGCPNDAKLIAAAPEMLDALIFLYRLFSAGSPMAAEVAAAKIRAALPEAVADEILGAGHVR